MSKKTEKATTKTHLAEKKRLENILKNQTELSENKITYIRCVKKLIEGVDFEHLVLNGDKTAYLKCLDSHCQKKSFVDQAGIGIFTAKTG